MLVRSNRLPYLLIFLAICLLWTAKDTFPSFQASNWTTYTLDISGGYWGESNSTIHEAGEIETTLNSDISSPLTTTTKSRKLVATGFPVVSKPSPYGYVFYATADDYACAALLNIKRLRELFHTRHQIHVLAASTVSERYLDAFQSLGAIVSIQQPPPLGEGSLSYYDGCLLKLVAFRMHEIEPSLSRVLVLDADQLILRALDSLFELPDVDVAAPRAYWIGKDAFASTFLLITLGDRLWQKVNDGMKNITGNVYDMDLVNQLFAETVMMLPGSYITLNSHFEDWNMPSWYRPEEKNRKSNLLDEKKEDDMADLWEAINAIVDTPPEPTATEDVQARRLKRQVNDITAMLAPSATPDDYSESAQSKVFQSTTPEPDESTAENAEPTAVSEGDASASSNSGEEGQPQNTAMAVPTHDTIEIVNLDIIPQLTTEEALAGDAGAEQPEVVPPHRVEAPHQPIEIAKPAKPVRPPPFPYNQDNHPLRNDLYDLYKTAYVLHYTAIGKPWMHSVKEVKQLKPQAHPALYEQFELWRTEAKKICPKMRLKIPPNEEKFHTEEELWKNVVEIV